MMSNSCGSNGDSLGSIVANLQAITLTWLWDDENIDYTDGLLLIQTPCGFGGIINTTTA